MTRITILETVYHSEGGNQPTSTSVKFSRELAEGGGERYCRRLTLKPAWAAVETGWVADVGLLLLLNEQPPPPPKANSKESLVDTYNVVEVGLAVGSEIVHFASVLPGDSLRLRPADVAAIRVRASHYDTRLSLTAYPK